MKYHVPDEGIFRVLKCTAEEGSCKYSKHFDSVEEAWNSFELENEEKLFATNAMASNDMFDAWDRTLIEAEESEFWNPEGKELRSVEEERILKHLYEVEEEIERHQELQRGGARTSDLWSFSKPLYAGSYIYLPSLKDAWVNSDYEKVRLLYAIAMSREEDSLSPGTIRMTPGELVAEAKDNFIYGTNR